MRNDAGGEGSRVERWFGLTGPNVFDEITSIKEAEMIGRACSERHVRETINSHHGKVSLNLLCPSWQFVKDML